MTDVIKDIQEIFKNKLESDKSLNYHKLEEYSPKFKRNTLKKVEEGKGNVIFSTIMELCDFCGYELHVRKKKRIRGEPEKQNRGQ